MPECYYPDIAFLVNFFLDYILLYVTCRLRRLPAARGRLCLSAAAGSLLAVLVTASGAGGMAAAFLFGGILMCALAFGGRGIRGNLLALFFCTFVMGGMLYALSAFLPENLIFAGKMSDMSGNAGNAAGIVPKAVCLSVFTVLAAALLLWMIRMHREKEGKPVYFVRFCIGEVPYRCSGLLDTGNGLYDPFRKKPVLLLTAPELRQPLEEFCKKQPEKVRYIPYCAVGTREGMLCGAELAEVVIETRPKETKLSSIPAVYAGLSGQGRTYQAILHPDFFK